MKAIRATIRATQTETRLLIQDLSTDLLIARLSPLETSHPRALQTLLESIALWFGEPLTVVLYADDAADWSRVGLLDALGMGEQTLHFDVEVVPPIPVRRRARALRGLGSFTRERRVLRLVRSP
jgi:hypothetical protein